MFTHLSATRVRMFSFVRRLMVQTILSLVALLATSDSLFSADLSPIPTESWQYRELDWLLLYPMACSDFQMTTRPYLRRDVHRLLDQSQSRGNTAIEWKLDKLRSEYSGADTCSSTSLSKVIVRNKVSPYSISHFADSLRPLFRFGLKNETAISYGGNLTLYLRGLLENKGHLDSSFRGKRWKENLTGYLDYGLLTYRRGGFTFQYGRSFRVWGPGDSDRLLLSDNSPAFDQIAAQFGYKTLLFQTWLTRLDDYHGNAGDPVSRYFAGHRLSFKPRHNLEIGVSETVLYGREAGPDWAYLNPFLPYYWEQFNTAREDDNIYMGADFVWWPFEATRVYGELMLDDFQIDFVSETQQIGVDLGISRLGFWNIDRLKVDLQYTLVKNYVYGQNRPQNIFTFNGVIIGSSLGPDSDRIRYAAAYALTRNITVTFGGAYRRRGEGRVTDRQDVILPRHQKFPSGTVEKTWDNHIDVTVLYGSTLDLQIRVGHYHIDNLANTSENVDSPYAGINIQYDFQRWLKL